MKPKKRLLYSLLSPFAAFKESKHIMRLPKIDCTAIAIVYKGKMYGGFVKTNFDDDKNPNNPERVFNFLIKTLRNQIIKLKNDYKTR